MGINFRDWLLANETSPMDRTKRAAALGLGPTIPDAEINSRSTAPEWMKERILCRNHPHKKHKHKKKHEE